MSLSSHLKFGVPLDAQTDAAHCKSTKRTAEEVKGMGGAGQTAIVDP